MKPEVITSVQNPRIKAVAALRERRGRDRQGRILIDGRREIARALESGVQVDEVFFCSSLLGGNKGEGRSVLGAAQSQGARLTEVDEAVFGKIAYGDRAEGVVVTALRRVVSLGDLRPTDCPLVGVVEGIEKPGNLGAILRSADGAGVDALIAVDPVTDVYGPNVIRASLGTVFCVPVVVALADEVVRWLRGRGIGVIAADPAAETAYTDVDMTGPIAVVLGSEAGGLTGLWSRIAAARAKVPLLGRADSLNVATAAALFFYEARRQRGGSGPMPG